MLNRKIGNLKEKVLKQSKGVNRYIVEQLIRPTGLLEPSIEIRPTENQIKDLISEIRKVTDKKQRALVITLTKRLAEALSDYLSGEGISCSYLHSEIKTLERPQILKDLRLGKYDVLVGINLLREGLDLPEVELVAILDADKEGFLRSETTLIQTMGRAARHIKGRVILYADKLTKSMDSAIKEVKRRRKIQVEYNKKHNITPKPIIKEIRDWPFASRKEKVLTEFWVINDKNLLEEEMKKAARDLDFERAAWTDGSSLLKLVLAGYRNHSNGKVGNVNGSGRYWSSTVDGPNARFLVIYPEDEEFQWYANMGSNHRAYGYSVRCIKD